jgi:hypothetical protein
MRSSSTTKRNTPSRARLAGSSEGLEFKILLIAFLKRDVALVAIGAILGGVIYSSIRAFSVCLGEDNRVLGTRMLQA